MAKVLYTARRGAGGAQEGHGRTSDGALEVDIRSPRPGGPGGGTNPEQLFAVGFASCFESALGGRAARQGRGRRREDQSKVNCCPPGTAASAQRGDGRVAAVGRGRRPAGGAGGRAHKVCPYSNATRGNIDVTFTANGQEVG